MRLAVYHNQHAGGAARVIESYLRQTRGRHQVDLFMPDTADTGFIDLESLVDRVHRIPIPGSESPLGRYRRAWAVPGYGKRIAAEIDRGDFEVVFANLSYVTQSPEILPYLKTPSVYYCPEPLRAIYDPVEIPIGSPLKRAAKKAFFAAYDAKRKRFDRQAITAADRVFTHSLFTRETLRRIYGVQAEVIHLGVDTDTFRPKRRRRERFVISVGAMHPLKGHQFVIEALGTLPAAGRPPLTIVGPRGDYGVVLEGLAKNRGVSLTLKQSISTDELVDLYNRAGVMAAAQYREPFGLITLEAMACGTPVVAVAEGGLKETVRDGHTGLLTPRDPAAFGSALARVLGDAKLTARLGTAGRQDTEQNWQWSVVAEKIDRLLAETARAGR